MGRSEIHASSVSFDEATASRASHELHADRLLVWSPRAEDRPPARAARGPRALPQPHRPADDSDLYEPDAQRPLAGRRARRSWPD